MSDRFDFLNIPADFGGLIGFWRGDRALVARYGQGQIIEGMVLTPLNLLQARKIITDLIAQGEASGEITVAHHAQCEQLPTTGLEGLMPRDQVDKIAGTE